MPPLRRELPLDGGTGSSAVSGRFGLAAAVLAGASLAVGVAVAPANDMQPVGPAGIATSQVPFDEQFIDMMAAHHAMAVEMAKLALKRAKHPELKAMARKMIAAQSKEIAEFHSLRRRWYGSARFTDFAMNEMMMRMMGMGPNEMKGLMRTNRFDFAFLSGMIPHHSGAITMARWETQDGTHPLLRRIAAKIIRDQARETGQMIQMRISWYGS